MHRFAPKTLLTWLGVCLPLAALLSLSAGSVAVSPGSLWTAIADLLEPGINQSSTVILVDIRLPRVLLALTVGTVLAASGAVMQGLFRNPLADPSLIGVSSGASVGASLMIVAAAPLLAYTSSIGLSVVALGAFVGGFLATILVYRLATTNAGTSVATMLLAGIAISAMAGAVNSLLGYFADNDMLRQISLWQMGNFSSANWSRVALMAAVAVLLGFCFPRDSRALNAMLLGESEARHLGVHVERVKGRLILLTALGVGVSVAVAGLVAFVGLVVPHVVRLMIGPDHRGLIPASALAGGLLLVVADTLARVAVAPAEIPTGIVTALLGAPFFVALLMRQRVRL